jgi:hypothetical protein
MGKNITVEDVVKGKADLTDVRFMIVLAMLREDEELVRRVKAYIEQMQFPKLQEAHSTM